MTRAGQTDDQERVSLAPIDPVDALRALLAVDPEADPDSDRHQDDQDRDEGPSQ